MIAIPVARMIANLVIILECSSEEQIDPDYAVDCLDAIGPQFRYFENPFLRELIDAFAIIAPEYKGLEQDIVRSIPESFWLEDQLAEDDPVRLAELDALRKASPK